MIFCNYGGLKSRYTQLKTTQLPRVDHFKHSILGINAKFCQKTPSEERIEVSVAIHI